MNDLVASVSGDKGLRVVVVGAGLAGLTAARTLSDHGLRVVTVDKSRGTGGRMSTRRRGECRYDHGAQYFTARDERFMRSVVGWQERGLVQRWGARIAVVTAEGIEAAADSTERFVAVPAMNSICRDLAGQLEDCRFGWQAASASHVDGTWSVTSAANETVEGDALVVAVPPAQARSLLNDAAVDEALGGFEMQPCWTLMLELDKPLFTEWDAAFVNHGPLSWLAGQASRPQRPENHAWVLHAGPDWSSAHLEERAEVIIRLMLDAVRKLPGAQAFEVRHAEAHRWRYALASRPLTAGALWYASKRLAVAGDWCHGSRVEGAFLSGAAAAARILGA